VETKRRNYGQSDSEYNREMADVIKNRTKQIIQRGTAHGRCGPPQVSRHAE
jgi:hypothetical protein